MNVATSSPLPSRLAVRNLLEGLVGRDVTVNDGNPLSADGNVVAVYVTDAMVLSAVAVVDIAAGARLGGALAMLPKGGIDDAIADKDMFPTLRECCYEILNVLSAVFNVPGAPHVKLDRMIAPGEACPADVAALAATMGNREDLTVDVAGYGPGILSIVCR